MEEAGGQIVESSDGKIVIRTPVKDEKECQDWLQDFQLKSNSAWIARKTFLSSAELHSRRVMLVNIQTLIKLSTVANGVRIQSVRRNYRLRLNRLLLTPEPRINM
jgi:hypothetical protein